MTKFFMRFRQMRIKVLDVEITNDKKTLEELKKEQALWPHVTTAERDRHDIAIESLKDVAKYAGYELVDLDKRELSLRSLLSDQIETLAMLVAYLLYGNCYGDVVGTYNASTTIHDEKFKHVVIVRDNIN